MTSHIGEKLSHALTTYKRWVTSNPQLVGDSESILKWCSYLVAGYVNKSVVFSELLFSAANLVTFLNDRILSGSLSSLKEGQYSYIEKVLSMIEIVEVFLEIAAFRFGGPASKWAVIVAIQVLKTTLRVVLLFKQSGSMLVHPLVPALDRTLLTSPMSENQQVPPQESPPVFTFTLKRSGRVIRKVEGAPPSFARDWSLPSNVSSNSSCLPKLEGSRQLGELLHICQPIAHLVALGIFGEKSWKPFLLSLAMDCSSQTLHGSTKCMTEAEQKEIVRRRFGLINYLLRSPFYDNKSKAIIIRLLQFSQENIPLAGSLSKAILRYLPEYQQIYFYIWG